jgi:hypothetical protein
MLLICKENDMVIYEQINETLVRAYSDKGVYIHGGYPEADYVEAIDPISMNRTYVETDIPIEETEATAEEALNILLGRTP